MPQFLKSQTISLLEGGLEAYSLALCGLVLPYTNAQHKTPNTHLLWAFLVLLASF